MKNFNQNKIYNFFLIVSLVGMVACYMISYLWAYKNVVDFQRNAIGALYLEEKFNIKEYLYALFENTTQTNLAASDEALKACGFTETGIIYIGKAMGVMESGVSGLILLIALFIWMFYILYRKERFHRMQIQELEAKLHLLQQNESKEEYLKQENLRIQNFIENVSHQIKTPVSRVVSTMEILEDGVTEEDAKQKIQECYLHLESIHVLMKRLMDIGRLEAGKVVFHREKIQLDELLEDIVRSCCQDCGQVQITYEDENLLYYGDYEWLKEAFGNILRNAIEADKSGKAIEMKCSRTLDAVKIAFRDHGTGIHEKDIPNIFNRFYLPENVKSNHTGIGLNLSKLIIEGHRGSVYAYNHVDGGAIFQVILPTYYMLKK